MKDTTQASLNPVTHELDSVLVERELETFSTVLLSPVTRERLDDWAGGTMIRADILSDTVWGTIRWRKSLGRPLAASLAAAFVIEHRSWQTELVIDKGVGRWVKLTIPHPEPSKWDGPHDDEFYRVSFMAAASQRETRIRVDFAAGVAWERRIQVVGPGYKDIDPPSIYFEKGDKRHVLEPFEVITKPYSLQLDK